MSAVDEAAPGAVVADRFPALVRTPWGQVLRDARVVLTRPEGDAGPQLWIWTDVRPTPRLELRTDWTPADTTIPHGREPWRVATSSGELVVERGLGCGCRSPLRRMRPWSGYHLAALPREVKR